LRLCKTLDIGELSSPRKNIEEETSSSWKNLEEDISLNGKNLDMDLLSGEKS